MAIWKKKNVSNELVKEISKSFSCDLITSCILARRGITEGSDILFYLENDQRFMHNPFLFDSMEDAVDRIMDAVDEGEKVLIFGDRDVDGITSTIILYEKLKELGLDVTFKVPTNDESYGLSKETIDEFEKNGGTLIITVDCGIANVEEVAYANEKSISVIVTDHHNPQETLPQNCIIINPKMEACGYPFKDISGCAVSYKLVKALEFAKCEIYKQEICLLNVRPANDSYIVECIKIENMKEKDRISETIVPGVVDIYKTRLIPFLQGQQIFVWDMDLQKRMLNEIFGKGIDFNMMDLRPEISKVIPAVSTLSLLRLKDLSKIARYDKNANTELDSFFNIFVTYIQKTVWNDNSDRNTYNLQLVALAAIADIMPLINENRIFIKQGLASLNSGKIRPGLQELMAHLGLIGKHLSSLDLGWKIVPALNSTGRLGEPETALMLFTSEDNRERDKIAQRILELNQKRKTLSEEAWDVVKTNALQCTSDYNNNLCVIYDTRVNRGVTGPVASKLMSFTKVPSIVITEIDDCAIGSARSNRGYNISNLLNMCESILLRHGGHNFAAGFSLEKNRVSEFLNRLKMLSNGIEFTEEDSSDIIEIAAELPEKYINEKILDIIAKMEPYGNGNNELNFLAKNILVKNAELVGKGSPSHLKLSLSIGGSIWPALFWGAGERLNRDFNIGDRIDVIFQMGKNVFNGSETLQLTLKDLSRSGEHEIVQES